MSDPALEAGAELAEALGASGLKGAGALGLYWLAAPSLQAVGRAFGDWTDWRLRNLLGLGEKIQERRTDNDREADKVHPRVIQEVFDRGSWTNDDVAQEYLAGVLCSSRCPDGDDEEGAYLSAIVASLTGTQVRLHHMIYSALHGVGTPTTGFGLETRQSQESLNVYIPEADLVSAGIAIDNDFPRIRSAVAALAREGLIGAEYGVGGKMAYLASVFPPGAGPGLLVSPTGLGVEIFLRAYGFRLFSHNQLLDGIPLPHVKGDMPKSSNAQVGAGRV